MAGRRSLIALVLLASALHAIGIARSILPAQDGLKFIRIARAFQHRPWSDVVRGTDQHPLYPALVALAEPGVSAVMGRQPDAWRIAAQLVSAGASLALLWPLFGLSRALFGPTIARLAILGFVLLPLPMTIGHDTLSDSLALLAFLLALRIGLIALATGRWDAALGCGLVAGVGYLARPEVLVAPFAVLATGAWQCGRRGEWTRTAGLPRLVGTAVAFLAIVGMYAMVKGELSEKLALRQAAAMGPGATLVRKTGQWLPPGLDDPRWDFSPKEEPATVPRRSLGLVVEGLLLQWSEGLGGILAVFALWGLVRDRHVRGLIAEAEGCERSDPENLGRMLIAVYLGLFALVLVRHELRMGYLSGRHTLTLVTLSLPWAAAGVWVCARAVATRMRGTPARARAWGLTLLLVVVAVGVRFQVKTAHQSRWGHREAGRWLAAHSAKGDAVLDTRGWAAFVSQQPSYDYWHVKQALTDSHLAYVVVGADELSAESRRAATLRALLGHAARPVVGYPERQGGHAVGVWVYKYERPDSWEGLQP